MESQGPKITDKKYLHVIEGEKDLDAHELDLVTQKINKLFPNPVKRMLFVSVPQFGQEHFVFVSANKGMYPSFPPYGPGLLISAIEQSGYQADIVDLNYTVLDHAVQATNEEDFNFEIWREVLAEKVKAFEPDVIGLSCMFNMGHSELKNVANSLKQANPDTPLIAGGVHPSLTASQLLDDIKAIDFVIMHEAEQSLLNFLEFANRRVTKESLTAIATQIGGTVLAMGKRNTPPTLPYKANYKELPIQNYSTAGRIGAYSFLRTKSTPTGTVLSRRGCRAQCTFCSVRTVSGAGVRVRDYMLVVDEIEQLKNKYGIQHIMWLDDDLFYDNDRAIEMFREIARRRLDITWDATNGIIAAALNPELLDACVASGCVGFNIGVESGNPEILRHMRKPGTVEKFIGASKLLLNYPQIFTKGFLIIGYPNETLRSMQDTLRLADQMKLDWYPSQILTPMPGTPVHQMMLDQEMLSGIPSEVLGKGRTFAVGVTGAIRKREMSEKASTADYINPFCGDLDRVPTRAELTDIWLTMDYLMNYKAILDQTDPVKITKKKVMLKEIFERMTVDNPLGTLFYGICLYKLNEYSMAKKMINLAEEILRTTAFWQVRFEGLGIDQVMNEYKTKAIAASRMFVAETSQAV